MDPYAPVKRYLVSHADSILKHASSLHRTYIGRARYRKDVAEKYRIQHKKIIMVLAKHLEVRDIRRGSKVFRALAKDLAKDFVSQNLTIEESVNGIAFLKQSVWRDLKKHNLLGDSGEYSYHLMHRIGLFSDIVSSALAFTYHNEHIRQLKNENLLRMNAEKAFKKEERTARHIVETIREPLIVLGDDLRVRSANASFYKTFRMTRKETLGNHIYELGNGQWNFSKLRNLLEKILPENRVLKDYEVNHTFDILGEKTLLFNARQMEKANLILLAIEDITQRKIHEQAILASEAKFRILAEGIKDYAVFMLDTEGNITSWNKGAERITGYGEQEVLGENFSMLRMNVRRGAESKRELRAVDEKGRYLEMGRRKRKDGTLYWADVFTTRIYENKHMKGYVTIIRDITAQKQAEDNLTFLSEASRLLASSLDYTQTLRHIAQLAVPRIADWFAIDMLDGTGKMKLITVMHKNPHMVKWAQELRSASPPDMSSQSGLPKVIRTGQPELVSHITDEMLNAPTVSDKERRLVKKIGLRSIMIVPLFRDRKTVGGITFVTAETKRHFTQKDLDMAEELANRASVALEHAALYQSSQDAVAARDNFIAVASHELKTPVTSVKIFADVLKKHSRQIGDGKAEAYLTKMDTQLGKLTELIYDLLNVSKIQAGKIQFHVEEFDFDEAVCEVVNILQEAAPHHRLIMQGKTGLQVVADRERIGQVLNNLVMNAVKYSPRADKVVIGLSAQDGTVSVAVRDYGIGIEESHLNKIFERFYRVYDTTDKTFPGLGIGLYICSEIVRRHGGKLHVRSNIGKGSTFTFTIPVGQEIAH